MRTIGLLGGTSRASSAGRLHSARLLLASVDVAGTEELQRAGDRERPGAELAAVARSLPDGGADLLVLCTDTTHLVADAIAAARRHPRCCTAPTSPPPPSAPPS